MGRSAEVPATLIKAGVLILPSPPSQDRGEGFSLGFYGLQGGGPIFVTPCYAICYTPKSQDFCEQTPHESPTFCEKGLLQNRPHLVREILGVLEIVYPLTDEIAKIYPCVCQKKISIISGERLIFYFFLRVFQLYLSQRIHNSKSAKAT